MDKEAPIIRFRDTGTGCWISELDPTIATPGIFIIIDTNTVTGQIALTRDRPNCDCATPLHCPNIPVDQQGYVAFPCSQTTMVREALDVFSFTDAPNLEGLVFGMRTAMGVDTSELDNFCKAALECLTETEWDLPFLNTPS